MATRQHAETTVSELVGRRCQQLLGVPAEQPDQVAVLYLQVEDSWHRVFVDAEVLFVDECEGPDREDDLDEGQDYRDLAAELGCAGEAIADFSFREGVLALRFGSGVSLTLYEDATGATVLRRNSNDAPRS